MRTLPSNLCMKLKPAFKASQDSQISCEQDYNQQQHQKQIQQQQQPSDLGYNLKT